MQLTVEEEYLRLFLLRRGASDDEIAEYAGILPNNVGKWRRRRGFGRPVRRKPKRKKKLNNIDFFVKSTKNTPMEKVLDPAECCIMKWFLRDLAIVFQEARRYGLEKPDVLKFARAWREVYAEQIMAEVGSKRYAAAGAL